MASGTIKRLVRDRGFGFIRDDGGQEWFFHRSSVKAGSFEALNEGQRVSFDEEPFRKGREPATFDRKAERRRGGLKRSLARVNLSDANWWKRLEVAPSPPSPVR